MLRIENNSDKDITVYDSPFASTRSSKVPRFLNVKLKNDNNLILSTSTIDPNGYWTPLALVSSTLPPNRKRESFLLKAHETAECSIPVEIMLIGLERHSRKIKEAKSIMYRYSLCLHESEDVYKDFESDWLTLPILR